jgi:hypothetical protein
MHTYPSFAAPVQLAQFLAIYAGMPALSTEGAGSPEQRRR